MKHFKYSIFIFFTICLLFAVFREWEYDEAWSYFGNMGSTFGEVAAYSTFKFANNHVINSLYMRAVQLTGARAPFGYRVLSLVSFLIYSLYYYRYIVYQRQAAGAQQQLLLHQWLLSLLPFVLPVFTYFSMARGYALAIAGVMASFYYFTLICDKYSLKHAALFILWGIVSMLSILSFMFAFVPMLIVAVVKCHRSLLASLKTKAGLAATFGLVLCVAAAVYYVYDKGKVISAYDPNIAGGEGLFKNGLFSSALSFIALQHQVANLQLFNFMRIAVLLTLAASVIIFYMRRKLPMGHIVFVVSVALMAVAHGLFAAKYPFGRSSAFLLLFLYLPMVCVPRQRKMPRIVFSLHFVVLALIGIGSTAAQLRFACAPNILDGLKYVNERDNGGPVLFELKAPNVDLYNLLYFKDKLNIIAYNPHLLDSLNSLPQQVVFVSCTDSAARHAAAVMTNTGYRFSGKSTVFVHNSVK